jgi:hypothetical protein
MLGPDPQKWIQVGTIQTESWTAIDEQGLREIMIATGKGNPSPEVVDAVQIKQRVLAGVAALLLHQLGSETGAQVVPTQARDTSVFASSNTASSYAPISRMESQYSAGCLVLAFLFVPWLWAILILSEKDAHETWVQVIAWIVLLLAAISLLALLTQH